MSLFLAILAIIIATGVIVLLLVALRVDGIIPAFFQIIPIAIAICGIATGNSEVMIISFVCLIVSGIFSTIAGAASLS